jgi:hypothetical protein
MVFRLLDEDRTADYRVKQEYETLGLEFFDKEIRTLLH